MKMWLGSCLPACVPDLPRSRGPALTVASKAASWRPGRVAWCGGPRIRDASRSFMPMPTPARNMAAVYAIYGKEPFLRRQALRNLLRSAERAEADVQQTTFDGEFAVLSDVLDEVRTYSLLGGRRVVIVDDAGDFITRYRPSLEKYCQSPAESGTLVLLVETFPKTTKLYKIISSAGQVVECVAPQGRAVPGWLVRQCNEAYGKTLAMDAAVRLRELTSDSLGELDCELAKLAVYVGDRPRIERRDVDALVADYHEENVFALLDAMNAGHAQAAIERWRQVLATDRAAQGRSIAGLAWGVRQQLNQRLDPATRRALERRLADLLDADVNVKTSASDIGAAIEKWIVRHSAR
ncbi:MAG: DNA polymerase III subunit delta [Phycisphaerales bacterium]|nr:MAG: DNA polymerase III subunit delta [Phycisphaerales bacterium]